MKFLIALLITLPTLLLAGCAPRVESNCPAGGLALYLTAERLNGSGIQKADLSSVRLEKEPIVAAGEILAYTQVVRELSLTPAAIDRLEKLKLPMDGLGFVACADKKVVLAGAFWTPLSSLSYDGVSILVIPGMPTDTVRLDRGYPGSSADQLSDPLADPGFLGALKLEGKLR